MADHFFQRALITGASSGIGEAMAESLGRSGVPCVLVARRGERLVAIAERYDGFEVIEADLATDDGQDLVIDRIRDESDPIDLVVNNAGVGTGGDFVEIDEARLTTEVELNVVALTRISHAAATTMAERGSGYLLNVSSVASFQSAPGLAVYAATKAYVTSLSEALHQELKKSGVKVTALCPGLTKTEFQERSNTTEYESTIPDFMWTSAEMVAETGLRDVAKNRAVSVPGAMYKGLVAASGVTPRAITRALTAFVPR